MTGYNEDGGTYNYEAKITGVLLMVTSTLSLTTMIELKF